MQILPRIQEIIDAQPEEAQLDKFIADLRDGLVISNKQFILKMAFYPRKTRNSRNGVSRHFAARRKLAKKTINCISLSTHLNGDTTNTYMHLNLLVFFRSFAS
jgi:hypothetical protein